MGTQLLEMKGSHLLVKVLGQNVHLLLVLARLPLVPQLQLGNDLGIETQGGDSALYKSEELLFKIKVLDR